MVYVSTIVSGVASLGVFVALVSAIFFLVLTGLKWVSRLRATLYEEELERQKRLLLGNPYLTSNGSSSYAEERKGEDGFENIFRKTPALERSKRSSGQGAVEQDECLSHERVQENSGTVSADTARVREFVERLVEEMAGGPLDGTTVGRLSGHPAYLAMFGKYHGRLCQELARLGYALHLSLAHEQKFEFEATNSSPSDLKRLIKKLENEASYLPRLREPSVRPEKAGGKTADDLDSKSYEDILATAILNKIIENCQRKSEHKNENRRKAGKFRRRGSDGRTSDSDWSDSSRSDRLSLTIEEYIEEVTTAYEVSDDETCEALNCDVTARHRVPFPESGRTLRDAGTDDESSDLEGCHSSATELVTSPSSWEENWLFQKKRLRSTPNVHHPVPVPMLVPNPSEDFRALVGGVDADDLSDMSDCSDSILESLIDLDEQTPSQHEERPPKQETSDGKRVENDVDKTEELLEITVQENEKSEPSTNEKTKDAKSVLEANEDRLSVCEELDVSSSSFITSEVISQRDREFSVENVDLMVQCEPPVSDAAFSGCHVTSDDKENEENDVTEENENVVRCRIAEREKRKWKNPVSLPKNPYSTESIEKRDQRNKMGYFRVEPSPGDYIDFPADTSLEYFANPENERLRFKRDYYVKASKHPSGMLCSLPPDRSSKGNEQGLPSRESEAAPPDSFPQLREREMPDKNDKAAFENRKINRREFSLPNVKELAKHFALVEDTSQPKTSSAPEGGAKPESKQRAESFSISAKKVETEVDYSTVPVSEIVHNLQNPRGAPSYRSRDLLPPYPLYPRTLMEICRKSSSNSNFELRAENEGVRFNGKQVHSLTARSISREFREGLKGGGSSRGHGRTERGGSSGESDPGEVADRTSSSPTPSVDLRNMKKFWEEIITANANSTKRK